MTYEELIKEHLTGRLVKIAEIKQGDLVARVRPGHATIVKVDKILPTVGGSFLVNLAGDSTSVRLDDEVRLLNRPKAELPDAGRIIVWKTKVEMTSIEVEHPAGILMERSEEVDGYSWESADDFFGDEQILEWAPLSDNFFNDLRKDSIK